MCELFGISSTKKVRVNEYLKEFFSHSVEHPHGWGMAAFYEGVASIEKEPIQALKSSYLKERLRHKIEVSTMIAHIRLATVGSMDYENCHPFVRQDNYGRRWTLAHNGTMFDAPALNPYFYGQEGQTDSERLLYYFIDKINKKQKSLRRRLTEQKRVEVFDGLIGGIAAGNKTNLLFYDGSVMYVHTNYRDSLYYATEQDAVLFATVPLSDKQEWKAVPFMRLMAWRDGRHLYTGHKHGHEYKDNAKDMQFLFLDSSAL